MNLDIQKHNYKKEEYDTAANRTFVVIVCLTHSHRPVYAQVQRDKDEIIGEKIDGFRPALHCIVSSHLPASSTPQLGEEESAEGIDF